MTAAALIDVARDFDCSSILLVGVLTGDLCRALIAGTPASVRVSEFDPIDRMAMPRFADLVVAVEPLDRERLTKMARKVVVTHDGEVVVP